MKKKPTKKVGFFNAMRKYFVEIEKIANQVKQVPDEWINAEGNDVTQEMIDYLLPLIQGELPCTFRNGIPVHLRLY